MTGILVRRPSSVATLSTDSVLGIGYCRLTFVISGNLSVEVANKESSVILHLRRDWTKSPKWVIMSHVTTKTAFTHSAVKNKSKT